MEIWKQISEERLSDYEISNYGNIRHSKFKRNIKLDKLKTGHLFFRYKRKNIVKNFKVHRLVLSTFTEDKPEMVVNHKNNIPYDNRLENLEWCTQKENTRHYYDNFHELKTVKKYTKERLLELYYDKQWKNGEEFLKSLS